MKYLLDIDGKYYDIELSEGETKRLEYALGRFANVTALTVQEEPTLTKTGWGFLRVEFDNGNVWESKIATIARPIDNLNEQEKACVGIAMRIAQLRKQQGMSQTQLAEAAGTNQFHISKIESVAVSPTIDVLARIAAALGKRIDLVD